MLSVRGLDFAYRAGGESIIEGLDHFFDSGRVTAVTGPSGVGKSTLLYILALMLRPTSGVVSFEGSPISATGDEERSRWRAQSVGFVFQDAALDPSRSVLANVVEGGLYARLERETLIVRARRLLDRFGVDHRVDHRPGQISGGQAQRVALCRALVKQPTVLLADEPTGNLDADSTRSVWQALTDAAHDDGTTVVVATHDLELVRQSDHRLTLGGVWA